MGGADGVNAMAAYLVFLFRSVQGWGGGRG